MLLERLGSGGFGEVWRARDELLQRDVAVKRIPGGGIDPRAAREAQAAARLSHPAIVALYEAASEDGAFYLTSELVDGATLAQLCSEDLLDDEEILEIGVVLCDALDHAHERGVIHRDVKPQNILVPDDPGGGSVAKLTDFGGARLDGEDALTRTGDVLGTLAYMAPEQCEGDLAGPEADLYALALVLYEALSGENPVRAATPAATVRRIGEPLPSLRRHRPDLPRRLTAAIDAALRPDPEDRGELDDLAAALGGGVSPASRGDRRARAPHPPRNDPRPQVDPGAHGGGLRRADPTAVLEDHPPPRSMPDAVHPEEPPPSRRRASGHLAPPKLLWVLLVAVAVVWALAAGRPGLGLLLLAALLPLLVAMPRRAGLTWLSCALSPALGLAGLAAAFPALAGRPRRARQRLALGALGFWWLCLAALALAKDLSPAPPPGLAPGGDPAGPLSAWQGSLGGAEHALGSLLTLATLAGLVLWALGALVLPWIVRGRRIALDLAFAGAWSAAMLIGPGLAAAALRQGSPVLAGGAGGAGLAALAAVLGALLAAGSRIVGAPRGPDALKVEL